MVGARQKPTITLQDRRPQRTASAPVVPDHVEDSGLPPKMVEGEFVMAVPDPPRGLRPHTIANWQTFWTSPLRPYVIGVDRFIIDDYFYYMNEFDIARSAYRRKKTDKGSTGHSTVVSHHWKVMQDCRAEMSKFEAQLGIGPLSRMRLNISFAQAAESLADMLNALNGGKTGPEWVKEGDDE